MFKVGDWVRYTKADNAIYKIIEVNLPYNNVKMLRNRSKYVEDKKYLKHWQPKEGEWCWWGFELVEVLDAYNLEYVKICRQQSDSYEEVKAIQLEPFIGELPSFIKEK